MTGYLEALRAQAMSWLRALPSDDLDQPVDLKSAGGPDADHHHPVVWAEVEDDPAHPKRILTVRGIGYKLSAENPP